MVDLDKLRGISKPQTPPPSKEEERKIKIVERGLERAQPNLPDKEKDLAVKQLMEKVNGKIGEDKELSASDLDIDSLAFSVASSLQAMESETCPVNEYFNWIEDAQDIIKDMNDHDITDSDINRREEFLGNLDQRETEMRVYMALYASCNSPTAKERLAFLQVKLAKLMELRSAVKASTKDKEQAQAYQKAKEEEKRVAEAYVESLEYRKHNPDSTDLYSEAEYKAALVAAQTLIALAAAKQLSEDEMLQKKRYEEYLAQRMKDLQHLRDFCLKTKDVDVYSMHNLKDVQMDMARYTEMMNLVKVATTKSRHGYESEEEQTRREICCAVLEYRRRGKDVPERILYQLEAKSFVPDYSMSEEILNKNIREQSKNDVIRRINELSGRQSYSNRSQSGQQMQRFDSQRFIQLQKMREAGNFNS